MPKFIGAIVCFFKGHKRGKFVRGDELTAYAGEGRLTPRMDYAAKVFACPRCGRETRYKVKDGNNGAPGDHA